MKNNQNHPPESSGPEEEFHMWAESSNLPLCAHNSCYVSRSGPCDKIAIDGGKTQTFAHLIGISFARQPTAAKQKTKLTAAKRFTAKECESRKSGDNTWGINRCEAHSPDLCACTFTVYNSKASLNVTLFEKTYQGATNGLKNKLFPK